jgi:hypothetical protein
MNTNKKYLITLFSFKMNPNQSSSIEDKCGQVIALTDETKRVSFDMKQKQKKIKLLSFFLSFFPSIFSSQGSKESFPAFLPPSMTNVE